MSLVYGRNLTLPRPVIVLITITIVLAILTGVSFFYPWSHENQNIHSIVTGLVGGFVIFVIQFIIEWDNHSTTSKIKSLHIENVIKNRRDKDFYGDLIKKTKRRIWVLGSTANRLLDDFADVDSKEDNRELISALNRGVEVQVLLPIKKHLKTKDQGVFDVVLEKLKILSQAHEGFEYRYFDHVPAHSIFLCDETLIAGPMFQHLPSRETPAIRFAKLSIYSEPYEKHFEEEWEKALAEP